MNRIYDLCCEYKKNPMQTDVKVPRFSWKIEADGKDIVQVEWELLVWEEESKKVVWRKVEVSNKSVHIEYEGELLEENKRYNWRVKSILNNGKILNSEEIAFFETGLWNDAVWKGIWIGKKERKDLGNCPCFRKSFKLDKKCRRGKLFISACGLYELSVNGAVQGEYKLTPGWTNYNHNLQYLAYDITAYLQKGENVVGVRLGDGWYDGEISFNHQTHVYGNQISFAAVLIIEDEQGERVITTDTTWKTHESGIISSSIYDGEIYDLTKEELNWDCPAFEADDWQAANIMEDAAGQMTAMINEGTKCVEVIEPKEIIKTPNGDTLIDMGQNMTGWVRITLEAKKGDVVRIKHGEVLDKEGNFYSQNLRLAKQEDEYILRKGKNVLEPHFTFHGFRYIKILKFPKEVKIEYFEGIVLHTAMEPSIKFECSDALVNQLHHNLIWGQKGNFLDVPTDCPQRDERLGWTGDAQIFCRTACYNFGADAFFTKWLEDVKADQYKNGAVPFVVPDVLPKDWEFLNESGIGSEHTSAAWGDAITICPWTLYQQYGDIRILESTYEAMKKYLQYIFDGAHYGSGNPYIWDWGPQLGDWLALDSEEGSYRGATDETYIATAYYAFSAEIVCKVAKILGKIGESKKYLELYKKIKENFKRTYMENGKIRIETQTAQIVPLHFNLLEGEEEKRAVEKLVLLLHNNQEHLTTGFVGTPYLCAVLSKYGFGNLAYTLLLKKDFPSWLYQVTKGATTIWEHWDGQKPDGSFWSDNMNSFNHYAYGSIGEWFYRYIAGIDTDDKEPGFSHIQIRPQTDARLSEISCEYESIRGKIVSNWRYRDKTIHYHIEIPANTKATIYLEDGVIHHVGSGIYDYVVKQNI